MKRKYLFLVCIGLGGVLAWMCCVLRLSFSGASERTRIEGLREALRRQLESSRAYNNKSGVVVCADNKIQALKMFESHILLEDCNEDRINRLRYGIAEGKSWVYEVASGDDCRCYLLDLFPSLTDEGCGFFYFVSDWNAKTGIFSPPCENYGILEMLPKKQDFENKGLPSVFEEYCLRLPQIKDALLPMYGHTFRPYVEWPYVDVSADVSVIVDVVNVDLVEVKRFEYPRYHDHGADDMSCSASYRVRLDVRSVVSGQLPADVLILNTQWTWDDFAVEINQNALKWLYYRGMTLRIDLYLENGEFVLINKCPVEPYPPYSSDNVRISGGTRIRAGTYDEFEGRLTPLVVEYGSHTKVEFRHGDIMVTGRQSSFVDFGVTSRFRVLELKEGANKTYWENAWFTPKQSVYSRSGGQVTEKCNDATAQ